jgi:3'-phosphoadenosine 5'-phosphosulfate (PAPS) 3'-phosphatase
VIQRAFPDDSLLTEEGQDDLTRVQARRCWIVDPIDGTEQFIRRTGEFDVLVAFIEDGRPVAVAGFQPTTSMLIIAEKDQGAWVSINDGEYKRVSFPDPAIPLRVASSKWFGAPENAHLLRPIIAKLGRTVILEVSEIGFSPRMFLSPRKADALIGIRVGSNQDMASEWDFAVTDLVINEAGGVVSDLSGQSFRYNKPTPSNYGGLLASVSPTVHESLLSAIKSTSSAT